MARVDFDRPYIAVEGNPPRKGQTMTCADGIVTGLADRGFPVALFIAEKGSFSPDGALRRFKIFSKHDIPSPREITEVGSWRVRSRIEKDPLLEDGRGFNNLKARQGLQDRGQVEAFAADKGLAMLPNISAEQARALEAVLLKPRIYNDTTNNRGDRTMHLTQEDFQDPAIMEEVRRRLQRGDRFQEIIPTVPLADTLGTFGMTRLKTAPQTGKTLYAIEFTRLLSKDTTSTVVIKASDPSVVGVTQAPNASNQGPERYVIDPNELLSHPDMQDVVTVYNAIVPAAREAFGELAFPTFKLIRGTNGTVLDSILIRGFTPAPILAEGGMTDYQGSSRDTKGAGYTNLVGRIIYDSVDILAHLAESKR